MLYLIEILHQTTTFCKSSWIAKGLYLIEILHQTTTSSIQRTPPPRCILSKFYIKPQPVIANAAAAAVVSYRNSTSNHNSPANGWWSRVLYLIEILHQTTTKYNYLRQSNELYLIEILHQTTTSDCKCCRCRWLYLIEILHQTTTITALCCIVISCILSKFYIKPQLHKATSGGRDCCILSKFYIKPQLLISFIVLLFCCILSKFYIKPQLSTAIELAEEGCILSKFYIKPQPVWPMGACCPSCILSKFYIKPQPMDDKESLRNVVSYRNSTSNHNCFSEVNLYTWLYLIEILHQTTTSSAVSGFLLCCILSKFYIKPQLRWCSSCPWWCCILSKFYIKPQLSSPLLWPWRGCILSKFYIKPQLADPGPLSLMVVSYRNSTSNHNSGINWNRGDDVVSYRNSTSNHNFASGLRWGSRVVSYRNSTSNHNHQGISELGKDVVSYRNSTSNHNSGTKPPFFRLLYLIEILHQTTTTGLADVNGDSCILSKFYIKPQPAGGPVTRPRVVSYRNSTSNHNVGPHIDW